MHQLWHVLALLVTLLGVVSGVLLALVPMALKEAPAGFTALAPWLKAMTGAAVAVVALEWVVIH